MKVGEKNYFGWKVEKGEGGRKFTVGHRYLGERERRDTGEWRKQKIVF